MYKLCTYAHDSITGQHLLVWEMNVLENIKWGLSAVPPFFSNRFLPDSHFLVPVRPESMRQPQSPRAAALVGIAFTRLATKEQTDEERESMLFNG